MKRFLVVGALVGLTAAAVSGQPPTVTLFEGARLILGDGRPPIERGAILVQKGRVTAAGERGAVTAPPAAVRVDLSGKTVMPAIVNAHVHLGFQRGAVFAAESYTRENIVDQLNRYAFAGVAAVLSLGTDPSPIPDAIRADQRAGTLGGALFRMAGRGLAPPDAGPANAAMKPSAYGVRTEEEARSAVREQAARGVDVIKIWVDDRNGSVPKLSPELARAVIDEGHKHKLKVIAHIFYLDDAKWLARARIDGFAHLVRDREADDELVALMRDNGVVIIPNMAISQNGTYAAPPDWLNDPLFRAVTPAEDAERIRASFSGRTAQGVERATATFRGMERSVARMKAAGVKFAFGTDAGAVRDHVHAFTDHRELDIMVRAGLTPMEAITAATRGSAELAGLTDRGALTPGKSADFIVLDGNPLEDIRNTRRIARVYLRGAQVDREQILSRTQR
jgi:imidazolonepropionase-like amidohydrolase